MFGVMPYRSWLRLGTCREAFLRWNYFWITGFFLGLFRDDKRAFLEFAFSRLQSAMPIMSPRPESGFLMLSLETVVFGPIWMPMTLGGPCKSCWIFWFASSSMVMCLLFCDVFYSCYWLCWGFGRLPEWEGSALLASNLTGSFGSRC